MKRKNYKIWFYSPDNFEEIAEKMIKSKLNVTSLLGEVNYISGNNFEYIECKRID